MRLILLFVRKFCICHSCDGEDEFLRQFLLFSPDWHKDIQDGQCTCADSLSFTTSSVGDATYRTTCGRSVELTFNSTLGIKYAPWKFKCVKGDCKVCGDKKIGCPAFLDDSKPCTWRAYQMVPKLLKGEELNPMGLIANGKRKGKKPRNERELATVSGTRLTFSAALMMHHRSFAVHHYEMMWDYFSTCNLAKVLLDSDVIIHSDFSAHPVFRSEKELTCQQGKRASLCTSVLSFGTDFDSDTKYATNVWSTSFLMWSDDVSQTHAKTHEFRTLQLNKSIEKHSQLRGRTRMYEVTDKCGEHFFSKSCARELSEWVCSDSNEVKTLIRVFKITGHSAYPGDGEGGHEKAAVTSFITDEKTWRQKLRGAHPPAEPKPIVNSSDKAVYGTKKMRGRTKYQDQVMGHYRDGTKMPSNLNDTINERVHLVYNGNPDPEKKRFACRKIAGGVRGWYVWRFEASEPGVLYKRKRMCTCTKCILGECNSCCMLNVEGGPGPWVRVKLGFLDEASLAAERERRLQSRQQFFSRLRKGRFVPVTLDDEFLGCPFGIAKVMKKPYTSDRAIANLNMSEGDEIVDVAWLVD